MHGAELLPGLSDTVHPRRRSRRSRSPVRRGTDGSESSAHRSRSRSRSPTRQHLAAVPTSNDVEDALLHEKIDTDTIKFNGILMRLPKPLWVLPVDVHEHETLQSVHARFKQIMREAIRSADPSVRAEFRQWPTNEQLKARDLLEPLGLPVERFIELWLDKMEIPPVYLMTYDPATFNYCHAGYPDTTVKQVYDIVRARGQQPLGLLSRWQGSWVERSA